MTEAKKSNGAYYVWTIIGLLLMFGFGKVVPEFAGITPVGVSILGIFVGVLDSQQVKHSGHQLLVYSH